MAKLIFKYGVMNSGKTTTLLMITRNYEDNKKTVLIGKPMIDTKCGDSLQSRLNNNTFIRKCDFIIDNDFDFNKLVENKKIDVIMIDEAHFLNKSQVKKIAESINGNADLDDNLVEEVTSIVEEPHISGIITACIQCYDGLVEDDEDSQGALDLFAGYTIEKCRFIRRPS